MELEEVIKDAIIWFIVALLSQAWLLSCYKDAGLERMIIEGMGIIIGLLTLIYLKLIPHKGRKVRR